jgi:hypothetical protein
VQYDFLGKIFMISLGENDNFISLLIFCETARLGETLFLPMDQGKLPLIHRKDAMGLKKKLTGETLIFKLSFLRV